MALHFFTLHTSIRLANGNIEQWMYKYTIRTTNIVIIYVIKLLVFVDFCVRDAIHRCAPYFESIDINCFQLSDLVSLIMVRLTFDLARAERNVCALAVSRYQVIDLGCFFVHLRLLGCRTSIQVSFMVERRHWDILLDVCPHSWIIIPAPLRQPMLHRIHNILQTFWQLKQNIYAHISYCTISKGWYANAQ